VLRLLRRQFPASQIYWWLDTDLNGLLEGDPDLTGVIPFPRRRWASPLRWPEALASVRALRAWAFDWVIDLQALARSGVLAWLVEADLSIGLDDSREGAVAFYAQRVPRRSFHTHAVDWYLDVLRALAVPVHWDFEWLPPRPAAAASVRQRWRVDDTPWIALQPGARWLNKRWPVESFGRLLRSLAQELPAHRFAVLGGVTDQALGRELARHLPERCLDLCGQTSLPETIEWLRLSDLLVTNDTGPMHVAAALGRPVVALFGPTEPRRTGPYGQTERVLQAPLSCVPCLKSRCHYRLPLECLRLLEPDRVCRAVIERLAEVRNAAC